MNYLIKHSSVAIVAVALSAPAQAQIADLEALLSRIDTRSGQYQQLIEILQGADANRALAAFDVMVESGDATLIEVAINSALSATDSRIRARALWEALARKDSVSVIVDTTDLDTEEKSNLNDWFGPLQTWTLREKFPDTQCINVDASSECYPGRNLSVSGIRVDMVFNYGDGLSGQFALDETGALAGQIMRFNTKSVFPARIEFR